METPTYDEFDVVLERSGDGFSARVLDSPTGPTKPTSFVPPGSAEGLRLLVLTLRAVRGVRALESEATPDAKRFGTQLFNALFHDEALSSLRGSLHVAASEGRGLRLRLRFTDGEALANIPWELLYDPEAHRFLCQYSKYPVVRYIEIPEPVQPIAVTGPVRMLVVISTPQDRPELSVENEWQRLTAALKPLVDAGRLRVDRLPTASLDAVRQALLREEYHVFHFMGHGGLDAQGEGVLVFTGPNGLSRPETGHDLGVMLSNSPIRLAVLNSCEGARISEVDPYAGSAVSLVRQGIPAVVAMQFEITDQAAIAFSSTLYEAITAGQPVDLAVTLARQAILATSRTEWATPVLYLRARDGVIFDISAKGPLPPPLPAPTGLTAAVVNGDTVSLRWDAAGTSKPAEHWEVYRDSALVATVSSPRAEDRPPGPGSYDYTVIRVAEQGRRSAVSESAKVVLEPPPPPPPPPPPAPWVPPRPEALVAHRDGDDVDLRWEQADSGQEEVDHWEVLRDGSAIGSADTTGARDHPHGRGPFTYTVVAVSSEGERSEPSDPCVVARHGISRVLLLLALVGVLAGAAAFFFLIRGGGEQDGAGAPAAPTGLEGAASGLTVNLRWDPAPSDGPEIAIWRVSRDGTEVGTAGEPRLDDRVPKAGTYTYSVVAQADDGRASPASESWTVEVRKPPGPSTAADLTIRFYSEAPGAGSGEVDVTFQSDNQSDSVVAKGERLVVRVEPPGRLLAAAVRLRWSGETRTCQVDGSTTATCQVGDHPVTGVTRVTATVLSAEGPVEVRAETSSESTDPVSSNNVARHRVSGGSTTSTTTDSSTAGFPTVVPFTDLTAR